MTPDASISHQVQRSSPWESPGPMTPFRVRPGRSDLRLRGWLNLARAALWVGFRTTLPMRPARFKLKPRRVRRAAKKAFAREVCAERCSEARAARLAKRAARAPMDKDVARLWVWTSMGRARAFPALAVPRPRAAHRPRGRAAPAPGRGETAPPEGEDGRGADGGEDDGPPRLAPRPTRRRRGRPRKRRSFRAFTNPKTWRKRLAQAEAVAVLPGAVFAVFLPAEAPDETSRRLARVSAQIADRFAALARRLRREPGAYFAIAAATRAERGAFWPHAHAIVQGVSAERLAVLAARSGLCLVYAAPVQNARAASRYALGAHQKRHWDRLEGARGFWVKAPEGTEATPPAGTAVSSRNDSAEPRTAAVVVETPLGPILVVPGPVELGPGVRVVDPPRFLRVNAQAAASPSPCIRGPAIEALAAYASAIGAPLAMCGPPRPGAAPGKGGRQ